MGAKKIIKGQEYKILHKEREVKKVILFSVMILLFIFILVGITQAFQNEPEGFRGLEWEDPPGEDMEYYDNYRSVDDLFDNMFWRRKRYDDTLWYERKNDKLQIGGAKLEYIRYGFYKGQFMEVFISTDKDYKSLKDVVELKFGRYKEKNDTWDSASGMWGYKYKWSGDIATIILYNKFKKYEDEATLDIYSTKIYNQREEDRYRKIEEERRRKEEEKRKATEEGLADFNYVPETKKEKKESNFKEKLKTEKSGKVIFNGEEASDEEKIKPEEEGRGHGIRGLLGEGGRKIERQVEPPYPEWAQRQGMTGVVELKCWVLPSGDVRNVEVCQSSGFPELDELACQYLMMWKFEPIKEEKIQWGIVSFHFEGERRVKKKAEEKVSAKDRIAFISMESIDKFPKFEVKFKESGKETGVVIFEYDEYFFLNDITIKRGDGSVAQIAKAFVENIYGIREIGTVDLSESGNEDVFLVWWDGGTGMHHIGLNLINTQKCEIVGLVLSFSHQATEAIAEVSTTNNFYSEDYEKEREFLESIKYEYGFIGEEEVNKQSDNPDFAYYFWAKDNSSIEDGKMTIRRYKGKHKILVGTDDITDELITHELKKDNIIYTAYHKAGVVAYDEESDEHFILFHPDYMYDYITVLKKIGSYLLIGTQGEGLVVANVETFHLKRFRFDPPNDYIEKLEVLDSKIRINGSKEIDLPNF